ncbi:MAG: trigger factor family protein [Bacteroidia bacterium]|nr:trigger factor family protein [Bacteroidia bacterium]
MKAELQFPTPYTAEGKVTLSPDAYEETYRQRLRELRRELVLPGFRLGQVPIDVVMKKYGESILTDILTEAFTRAVEESLGSRKIIGLPYYEREPSQINPTPPFATYTYSVKMIVVPDQPLNPSSLRAFAYEYQPSPEDTSLYRRMLRVLWSKLEPLPVLPETLPLEQEILIRLLWQGAPRARISWTTILQPFPWSYLAGKKVGDTLKLPASVLVPYADVLRMYMPDFSPLTLPDTVELVLASAAQASPAPEETLYDALELTPEERQNPEAFWQTFMEKHIQSIVQRLNLRMRQLNYLYCAGVRLPEEVVQLNFFYQLRQVARRNGQTQDLEEYRQNLAWQVFFSSFAHHEPELNISDEELQEELWARLKKLPKPPSELESLISRMEESQEDREVILAALLKKEGDMLRRSVQMDRFDAWLDKRFGAPQTLSIPGRVLFLHLI